MNGKAIRRLAQIPMLVTTLGLVLLGCGQAGGGTTCDANLAGTWRLPLNEIYLQIDASCNVTEFCDVLNDLHTTGRVRDNVIVLTGIAAKKYLLAADTLTLLEAGGGGEDLPFARQASADVIPSVCASN